MGWLTLTRHVRQACIPLCTQQGQGDVAIQLPPPVPCHHPRGHIPCPGSISVQTPVGEGSMSICSRSGHFAWCFASFSQVGSKEKGIFLGNGFFVLEGFCCCLLTSLNCITPRYASDLHSLNPAVFDYICRYSN